MKINFTSLFLHLKNLASRKFKITYVICILFPLDEIKKIILMFISLDSS